MENEEQLGDNSENMRNTTGSSGKNKRRKKKKKNSSGNGIGIGGYGCKLCTKRPFYNTQLAPDMGGPGGLAGNGLYDFIYTIQKEAGEIAHLGPDEAKNVSDYVMRKSTKIKKQLKDDTMERNEKKMGLFDYDEINIGPLLGVGGFSSVYRIDGFSPKEFKAQKQDKQVQGKEEVKKKNQEQTHDDNNNKKNENGNNDNAPLDPTGTFTDHEVLAREFITAHAIRRKTKKQQYSQQTSPIRVKLFPRRAKSLGGLNVGKDDSGGEGQEHDLGSSFGNLNLSHNSIDESHPTDDDDTYAGKYRYAIKHLSPTIQDQSLRRFAGAALDLATEAQFLLTMDHPNIVRMRGYAKDGPRGYLDGLHNGYFLIIDLLPETLENRIMKWRKSFNKYKPSLWAKMTHVKKRFFSNSSSSNNNNNNSNNNSYNENEEEVNNSSTNETAQDDQEQQQQQQIEQQLLVNQPQGKKEIMMLKLFIIRVKVAFDIAAAIEYLHKRKIIYRDLKSANVGFDIRGDVKIYDFGLARLLPTPQALKNAGSPSSSNSKNNDSNSDTGSISNSKTEDDAKNTVIDDGTYKMSGVGTPSYMAPEVKDKNQKYGLAADVFSFGVLLWELLSLSSPRRRKNDNPFKNVVENKDDKHNNDSNNSASKVPPDRYINHKIDLPLCPCWPIPVQELLQSTLDNDQFRRPNIKQVRQTLLHILLSIDKRKTIDLSNRRRSTDVLEFSEDFLLSDDFQSGDHTGLTNSTNNKRDRLDVIHSEELLMEKK